MLTDILPPDRTWDRDTERLAQALVAGATSDDERTALYVLFRAGDGLLFARASVRNYLYPNPDGTKVFVWHTMALDLGLRRGGELLDTERALIELVCSLGNPRVRIRVVQALAALDEPDRELVLSALRMLVGGK